MDVTIYRDPFPTSTLDRISMEGVTEVICEGSITIKGEVYVDSDKLNGDGEIPERTPYYRHGLGNTMPLQARKEWIDAVREMHDKFTFVCS